jgi:hypothetical protein
MDTTSPLPQLADDEARQDLARVLMALFERWKLSTDNQLSLLGLSPESRKLLGLYRRGERGLPASRDALDRAGYLLGMHKALRLLFPENPQLRYGWINLRNRQLEGRTPLEVMLDEGLVGLARIARFLDFQCGQ